jgi:hypothetical protein
MRKMADEIEGIANRLRIFEIRKQAVVLDSDLAAVYAVTTTAFNQAIKRNLDRFPADFSFILTKDKFAALISQFVTSKGRGGRRKLPRVFTEHGAIMAATILNSSRAVAMSVEACPEQSRMGRAGVCPDAAGDICQCHS